MENINFQKFLSSRSAGLCEEQSKRIENNFNGSFSTENLVAEILAEVNHSITNYLKAYNDWLFKNFDILPKQN